MQSISILGADDYVGSRLLKKALDVPLGLKVLVHDKATLPHSEKLEIIEGSYFDKEKLDEVLSGSDAVLSTIDPSRKEITEDNEKAYLESLKHIITTMKRNGQDRIINLSEAGVKGANEVLPLQRKLLRMMLITTAKPIMEIKDGELSLLEQSGLNWTSVRPPMIKTDIEGTMNADENKFISMVVDVNQLAQFIIDGIEDDTWSQKAPVVGTK